MPSSLRFVSKLPQCDEGFRLYTGLYLRIAVYYIFSGASQHTMMLDELDYLQATIVDALDTIRIEIKANSLPHLSHSATTPHPLDSASFVCPPKLYEARRLALGAYCIRTLGGL